MHPSFRLFPVLLGLPGGHRNSTWQLTQSAWAAAGFGQPMADNSRQPCVARRGRWGPRTPCDCNR